MIKKSNTKKDYLLLPIALILLCFVIAVSLYNSPQNTIKRMLKENYQIDVKEVRLENTDRYTYKLLNAPVDPVSGVKLENWKIISYGMSGMIFYTECLDVSQDYEEELNVSIRLTNEQLQELNSYATEQEIDVNQAINNIILEKLNNE